VKRNYFIVGLIFFIFFVISILTNILGPLIPDFIKGFNLSLTLAAFMPFAFFVAYGVMSIPSGMLVERYQEKTVLLASFMLAFLGSILFASFPHYLVGLISLFLIGTGMAMLQVAINPLLRTAGGEENFAFFSVMAQLIFGGAAYLAPQIYTYLVINIDSLTAESDLIIRALAPLVPERLPWISLYWLFTLITLVMIIILKMIKLPKVELKEDERAGAWESYKVLFKNRYVLLYFIGIFVYVGSEQGVANWISKFLETYHNYDPRIVGADTVSYFWGLLALGCLLGLVVLKIWDSRKILIGFSTAAIISLTLALFGSGEVALMAFPAVGFFFSVMWSVIFSLALNSVEKHHGSFSGILCTAIVGGAIIPLIIGSLGDLFGLRFGMTFLYVTLGYTLSIGFWANPLITNATIGSKKIKNERNVS
jgi:fucose permease